MRYDDELDPAMEPYFDDEDLEALSERQAAWWSVEFGDGEREGFLATDFTEACSTAEMLAAELHGDCDIVALMRVKA